MVLDYPLLDTVGNSTMLLNQNLDSLELEDGDFISTARVCFRRQLCLCESACVSVKYTFVRLVCRVNLTDHGC